MGEMVSIVIPVFNTNRKMLCSCFNSVVKQSYPYIEVVVVDDGSDEKTARLCDEYEREYSYFKVYHKKNEGVSIARNYGISMCTGEYLTFLDSDDYVDRNYIEMLVNEMDNNIDCVMCGCEHVDAIDMPDAFSDGYRKKILNRSETLRYLLYLGFPYECIEITACWGKLYRKSKIERVKFDGSIAIGEDFVFNYHYFRMCKNRITCIDVPAYKYVIHQGSVMKGKYKPEMIHQIDCFERIISKEKNAKIRDGLISRFLNIEIIILGMMSKEQINGIDYLRLCGFIKKYRKDGLRNKNTSIKIKIALMISAISFKLLYRVMHLTTN